MFGGGNYMERVITILGKKSIIYIGIFSDFCLKFITGTNIERYYVHIETKL